MKQENRESYLDISVEQSLLESSGKLSWDEQQLIKYIRCHPEKIQELLHLIKNEGDT